MSDVIASAALWHTTVLGGEEQEQTLPALHKEQHQAPNSVKYFQLAVRVNKVPNYLG